MRYTFGDYVLDTQRAELQGAGGTIKLWRKAFQVLAYLLAHHDRVVPKEELLEQLWPEQFVGDETLKSCFKTLRQALGDRGRSPRFVRTLHGQGYRFVAPVEVREHLPADTTTPALTTPGERDGQPLLESAAAEVYALDLARLAHAQGNPEAVTTCLHEALTLFNTLHLPRWVEHTTQLASELGISPPALGQ